MQTQTKQQASATATADQESRSTTIWFVSRHPGAIDWLLSHGLKADKVVPHLEPEDVHSGDTVIGTFPVNLVAEICARGAKYVHISLRLPPALRGAELSCAQLDELGATLDVFTATHIQRIA